MQSLKDDKATISWSYLQNPQRWCFLAPSRSRLVRANRCCRRDGDGWRMGRDKR
jgi:hypothetical protein